MSAARTAREASAASSIDVKMFPHSDRNSTTEPRDLCQLSHIDSIGSGRKSPSLRYQ